MKKKPTYTKWKKSNIIPEEQEKLAERKLCNENDIRELKFKLRSQKELKKEQNLFLLIILIQTLNGINPYINSSSYSISEETKFEAIQIIKKIKELLKSINIFLFYFRHYKIDDKIIQRIIPNLKYDYYKKDEIVFKEGEPSNRFYFLLKGKISFKKKTPIVTESEPQLIEKFCLEEGTHFGEWDIIYERKKKTTAFCIDDCHIISMDRETFKENIETRVTKVESEVKNMLKNFLMKYMTLPAIKIERFIQTNIETLFFKRNEVIYREGDNNSFLFMINTGEANLIQNFYKSEHPFLMNYQYPTEYVKNMAKRIDYRGVIRNAFNKKRNSNLYDKSLYLNEKDNNENDKETISQKKSDKNKNNENTKSEKTIKIIDNNENENENSNKDNNNINDDKKAKLLERGDEALKLDLLLEKTNYQNIVSLNKGSVGGLEICTGITKFKYSLISNSDFTSVFKIDLRQLDGEHLTEFMLNLLPLFIDYEKKIHSQIKKLKYINYNFLPESCQKNSNKKNPDNFYFKDVENDNIHIKKLQKIDNMFQFNEGGFIKMNDYNLRLHKKKNEIKEILKENSRNDNKASIFLKSYVDEQNSKLKFRGMKKIIPIIPNYEIIEDRYNNLSSKENLEENYKKPSGIYYSVINGKNYFYLITDSNKQGKLKNKSKSFNKNKLFSKKYQEMFDKITPKAYLVRNKIPNKKVLSLKLLRSKFSNINYKNIFIEDNNYMRDLIVQRNQNNIHCYEKKIFDFKNNQKSLEKKSPRNFNIISYVNNVNKKKLTFFDTGKYDIPLLTDINDL